MVDVVGLKGEKYAKQNAHYRVWYKVSYRLRIDLLKKRVEMYQMARVDMIANQLDKAKILETYEVLFSLPL